jgi:hypothetical protein
MLKEVFISPQVFTPPTINPYSWKDVKYLLENLRDSGYIIGIRRKKWIKEVMWNISHLEPKVKDHLMHIVSSLKDRDRIVDHPMAESVIEEESGWLDFILKLNEQRNLYSIIATHPENNIMSLEQLEDININDKFGIAGSKSFILSESNMESILLPFLSYAKKITIIDPYFYVNYERYENSLKLIANMLGERRGETQPGSIVINCKWETKHNHYKKFWGNVIDDIYKYYGHRVDIFAWEEREGEVKMHDRYLISNQSGLVSAAGTNIDDLQQSEWSIKDYKELGNVLANYKENSSPFNLIHSVSTE